MKKSVRFRVSTKFLSILILIVFIPLIASSQKVGLVLSGGGAKGAAHIGVIRALEEEGIPIDYITGTSIGAIIGGLYAIGWTTEQMEEVILSAEFERWVEGEISEEYKFYFKKPTPNASWLNLRFKVDSVIKHRMPVNLVSPFVMDFVFMELYSAGGAAAGNDFNNLFVPFRSIAADVSNSRAVSLKSGNLSKAVRASMTFPFYFRPIRIDGQLLFDGGMYNNFPADIMLEEFFPEFVIGSRVSSGFGDLREDDLTSQLEAMLTTATAYEIPCENGVIIKPTLKNVNVIDFRHSQAFIDSGYVAAKRLIPEIRKFVYDTVSREELELRRAAFTSKKPPLMVDRIHIKGLDENQELYVNRVLRMGESQVPLEKIRPEYFKLATNENVNHISPELLYNETSGFFDLYLDVKLENDIVVEFGGNISSAPINSAFVGVRYHHLGLHAITASLNSYIGRFYSSLNLSARYDLSTFLPIYVEPSFTLNQWDYFKASTYFFEDKTPSFLQRNETSWGFTAGVPARNHGKVVAGFNQFRLRDQYYQTNFFTRADTTDLTRFNGISPFMLYESNTLNFKQFPSRGRFIHASARLISGEETYTPGSTSLRRDLIKKNHTWWLLKGRFDQYLLINNHYTLGLAAELVLSTQSVFANYTSTSLASNAFSPFPESQTNFSPEYRAHNYAALGFRNIFSVHRNIDLRFEVFAFVPYRPLLQDGNFRAVYGDAFSTLNLAANASFVFHSPIGPLSLSLNYFEKNENPYSFYLNIGYIIFNKRALD
jgi:NTE family protein